jgi:hypothetical protein
MGLSQLLQSSGVCTVENEGASLEEFYAKLELVVEDLSKDASRIL